MRYVFLLHLFFTCVCVCVHLIMCVTNVKQTILLILQPTIYACKSKYEAVDAKMLRVSISTTYDMINVALKCFQEFGE